MIWINCAVGGYDTWVTHAACRIDHRANQFRLMWIKRSGAFQAIVQAVNYHAKNSRTHERA